MFVYSFCMNSVQPCLCTAMFVYSFCMNSMARARQEHGTWYMVGARTWSTYMVPGKNMVRGKNMVHGRSSRKGELAGLAGIAANGLR